MTREGYPSDVSDDGLGYVVGEKQRADGRDAQAEHLAGRADDEGHGDGVTHLCGVLDPRPLHGLGSVGQSVAVHGQ